MKSFKSFSINFATHARAQMNLIAGKTNKVWEKQKNVLNKPINNPFQVPLKT